MSAAERFEEKCAFVKGWTTPGSKKVTNAEKLTCYGLFKQSKEGDVDGARPGMFSIEARAKFDASMARVCERTITRFR